MEMGIEAMARQETGAPTVPWSVPQRSGSSGQHPIKARHECLKSSWPDAD
jgi:hypothetical protein